MVKYRIEIHVQWNDRDTRYVKFLDFTKGSEQTNEAAKK